MATELHSFNSATMLRQQVLEQHVVLRELLTRTLEATTQTLRRDSPMEPLVQAVLELRRRFRAHLAFEERHLAPVLADTDVWGPVRVANLLEEHDCQRAQLDTLIEGIETDWDAERLALATRSLVTELLLDMEEEERGCLSAQLLRDDVVSIDQASD
jgi:hypothetical protein